MISHKYKCIFIHIPKCAGTSIEDVFGHLDGHTGRGGQDHRSLRMIQPITIYAFTSTENLKEVFRSIRFRYFKKVSNPRNKYTVTREQYNSYFKFTFVRNPWARAFSWHKNVMRDEIHKAQHGITRELSLNEFLRLYAGKGMLRPQLYWLKDFIGKIPLDFIGRFENLNEDFQKVTQHLKVPHMTLPHKIKGTGEDYRDHYDEESIALVRRVYNEEIKLFDYTFEH